MKEVRLDLNHSVIKKKPTTPSEKKRIWFHAASVGELESIWPLIIASYEARNELIFTILSESARGALNQLCKRLADHDEQIVFAGYSPWEGRWKESLQTLKPNLFVTAKYEAWPELWSALNEEKIPLAIVGARARKSLRIARKLCTAFTGGIPELLLFPCLKEDSEQLKLLFPESKIEVVGEPRWERVFERAKTGNARAKQLIEGFREKPRPWGVLGSAWLEDLKFLDSSLDRLPGTLWIVPHRIDPKSLQPIQSFLSEKGIQYMLSSDIQGKSTSELPIQSNHILVNEMGFLSELYSVADWAFIGGGFGSGVHSTIEPAIHGIPIGVGPKGTEKFSEIQELKNSDQLAIMRTPSQRDQWVLSLSNLSPEKKTRWMNDAQLRLGATQKILAAIENFI